MMYLNRQQKMLKSKVVLLKFEQVFVSNSINDEAVSLAFAASDADVIIATCLDISFLI